jgi:heme a synthase
MLHRFATLVACATLILIAAGGLVTSTGSGLSVPDWPTTYGYSMFTFPLSKMVGGIRFEHTHRLIASTVGLLMIVLAVWLWRREPRRWTRVLGLVALAAVIAQGLLGGITVLMYLPPAVSIAHAGLAQVFFCLTITLALVTSPGWRDAPAPVDDATLRRLSTVTTAAIYTQILIGAAMRHTGAGLAIPDFPLAFGHVIPPRWDEGIAIHFTHRIGALIVAGVITATVAHVWYHHRSRRDLTRSATILAVLLVLQITLGALTVLSGKDVIINTSHVATGALVLAASLVLALRSHRISFAGDRRSRMEPERHSAGFEARARA